jgi:acetyl-CoA carboxylase biotin carboxyl carrier protein
MNPLSPKDLQDLKQLIEFLKENQVSEFELDGGDSRVRLKFDQPQAPSASVSDLLAAMSAGRPPAPRSTSSKHTAPSAADEPAEDPDEGLHLVKSPIVGTFYGSPSPGAPPFVSVGERVEKGQVICIVEAMKLMNEIEADADGEIVKCLVSNGQAIEFGQPLFSIRVD